MKIPQTFMRLVPLLTSFAITGCGSLLNAGGSSDFTCDRSNNCPTPLEVYDQTNGAPAGVSKGRTPEGWAKSNVKSSSSGKDQAGNVPALRLDLTQMTPEASMVTAAAPPARPLREPSQVMRIWISPWRDSSDSLNWSGYVFTEVTPKRWSFGEQEVRHQGLPPSFFPR